MKNEKLLFRTKQYGMKPTKAKKNRRKNRSRTDTNIFEAEMCGRMSETRMLIDKWVQSVESFTPSISGGNSTHSHAYCVNSRLLSQARERERA